MRDEWHGGVLHRYWLEQRPASRDLELEAKNLHAWPGIPIVTIGAGDRMVLHKKDEWVDTNQLLETAGIFAVSILESLTS